MGSFVSGSRSRTTPPLTRLGPQDARVYRQGHGGTRPSPRPPSGVCPSEGWTLGCVRRRGGPWGGSGGLEYPDPNRCPPAKRTLDLDRTETEAPKAVSPSPADLRRRPRFPDTSVPGTDDPGGTSFSYGSTSLRGPKYIVRRGPSLKDLYVM